METIGARLKSLREGIGISQKKMAEHLHTSQASVARWEINKADVPNKVMLWYADFFDVSLDYIFGRTDKPQGKKYAYEPHTFKERMAKQKDWNEFVEACFDPNSPMSAKLKEMMLNMAKDK